MSLEPRALDPELFDHGPEAAPGWAGAQEFMGKHDEAMEHNEKLLAADEAAEGGAAEEAAAPPAAAEADQLAEQASQLKVRLRRGSRVAP